MDCIERGVSQRRRVSQVVDHNQYHILIEYNRALKKAKCPVAYFNNLYEAPERTTYINFEFPFPVAKYFVLSTDFCNG